MVWGFVGMKRKERRSNNIIISNELIKDKKAFGHFLDNYYKDNNIN